jgi:integrase
MDDPGLVQQAAAIVDRLSKAAAQITTASNFSESAASNASAAQKTETSSREIIREAVQSDGISEQAADIILQSWKDTTHKQYGTYFKKWLLFCTEWYIDPFSPSLRQGLDFLAKLFKEGLSYSALNTARSSLSAIVCITNMPFGQHPMVKRFMKRAFNLRPALPRNTVTWNVGIVLNYLKCLPDLSLRQLSIKLATLLLLLSGQRIQSLHLIDIRNVDLSDTCVKIRFGDLLKQTRPGYQQHEITLERYPVQELCVVKHLTLYLDLTKELRGTETALFLTTQKPHRRVSRDTISRWVRTALREAGLDMNVFKPHSIRSASTSMAFRQNVPLQTILNTAGWSGDCVFRKFYNKPISDDRCFSRAILASCS